MSLSSLSSYTTTHHDHDAQEGAEEGTDEADETIEDRNGAEEVSKVVRSPIGMDGPGDDVGDDCAAERAADPDNPVSDRVRSEVVAALEETQEDVLGWQLERISTTIGVLETS